MTQYPGISFILEFLLILFLNNTNDDLKQLSQTPQTTSLVNLFLPGNLHISLPLWYCDALKFYPTAQGNHVDPDTTVVDYLESRVRTICLTRTNLFQTSLPQ